LAGDFRDAPGQSLPVHFDCLAVHFPPQGGSQGKSCAERPPGRQAVAEEAVYSQSHPLRFTEINQDKSKFFHSVGKR
jgi:hypothetical protein